MVDAGVHYGHQTKKWNPRMKPFLMKDKGGIYIINLEKTVQQLDKAADFLADLVSKNKNVLFVGCKRQAQDAIREAGGIPLLVALLKREEEAVLEPATRAIKDMAAGEGTAKWHTCRRLLLRLLFIVGLWST